MKKLKKKEFILCLTFVITIFFLIPTFASTTTNSTLTASGVVMYSDYKTVPDFGTSTGAILEKYYFDSNGVACFKYKNNVELERVYAYLNILEQKGFELKKSSKYIGVLSGKLYYTKDNSIVSISINGRGYLVRIGKISDFSYLEIPDEIYDTNDIEFIKLTFEAMVVNNQLDYIFDSRAKAIHIQYNDWASHKPVDYWVKTFVRHTNQENTDIVKTNSLIYPYRGVHEFDLEVYSSNKKYNSMDIAMNSSEFDSKFLVTEKHRHTFVYKDGVWEIESRQHYNSLTGNIESCGTETSWGCIEKQINFY